MTSKGTVKAAEASCACIVFLKVKLALHRFNSFLMHQPGPMKCCCVRKTRASLKKSEKPFSAQMYYCCSWKLQKWKNKCVVVGDMNHCLFFSLDLQPGANSQIVPEVFHHTWDFLIISHWPKPDIYLCQAVDARPYYDLEFEKFLSS